MKKLTLSMAVLGLVVAGPVFANNKKITKTTTITVSSDSTAPRTAASAGSSSMDFAVGLSSWGGVDVAGGGIGGPALSAKIGIGSAGSVQALFAIASSDPFQFSVGGIYRHRVFGDGDPGFHLGAGVNLGTAGGLGGVGGSSFFLNIFPLAGFHFNLGGSLKRISLSFDGGLNFHITPGFQFQAGPASGLLGGLLGAAIHYQL